MLYSRAVLNAVKAEGPLLARWHLDFTAADGRRLRLPIASSQATLLRGLRLEGEAVDVLTTHFGEVGLVADPGTLDPADAFFA